ncbi:MAG: ABC transporter ATP-binding protein [Ruminococcaceae bacterium]|nr:ABC transporter ATP-binding protein [Oscillospiraceae bacterium]
MNKKKNISVPESEYKSRYSEYRTNTEEQHKPENAKRTFLRFISLIKPHSFSMAIVVISSMISTVCNVVAPDYMGEIMNILQEQIDGRLAGGVIDFSATYSQLAVLAGLYIAASLFTFIQEFVSAGVSQRLVCGLRNDLNNKLSKLPLSYFDKQTKGQVISKIVNDIENVSGSLKSCILTVMTSIIQVIGSLVMMLKTGNLPMTFVAVCLVPVSAFISYRVSKVSKVWFRRYWDSMGDLNGHIEEMYAGHTIVRMFGREDESVKEFRSITERLGKNSFMANMIAGILNPVLTLIKNINYVSICLLGGFFHIGIHNGTISPTAFGGIGDITKFLSYSSSFSSPIINLSKIINSIQSSLASAERVFAVLDEAEEAPDNTENELSEMSEGLVEFKDVSFRYVEDRPLIDDLSFTAKPGSVTAIVGPTGAGKTTIVNLLMRFYDIRSGVITLDGTDIYTMSRDALRNNFGMVLQDTWLFKGTVMENIRYGRADATDEEVFEAARTAQIYDYIKTLPEGFDTVLTEDATNISQGQRQLLTIARAVIKDPRVLILDEATSSVDTKTEQKIQTAMDELMKGRTSFVIAHRLSTIRNADNILVMKKGAIVEQGTHEELLEADGFYALLYNSQYTDGIPPED